MMLSLEGSHISATNKSSRIHPNCCYGRSVAVLRCLTPGQYLNKPCAYLQSGLNTSTCQTTGHVKIQRSVALKAMSGDKPENWTQVVSWAQSRFKRAVAPGRSDEQIDLATCCLLIALEEEASVEVHPELKQTLMEQTQLPFRTVAGASTWSLSRLDGLALQVYDLVMANTSTKANTAAAGGIDGSAFQGSKEPTGDAEMDSDSSDTEADLPEEVGDPCVASSAASQQNDASSPAGHETNTVTAAHDDASSVASNVAEAPTTSFTTPDDFTSSNTAAIKPTQENPATNTTSCSGDTEQAGTHEKEGKIAASPGTRKQNISSGIGGLPGLIFSHQQPHHDQQQLPGLISSDSDDEGPLICVPPMLPPGLFESEPIRVLNAINTVLFEWQGYGPSNRYGNPRDSQLSSVLEQGLGCSPALSILYMQVAERLGIQLAAKPLEDGRYWLVWPQSNPDLLQQPSDPSNSSPNTVAATATLHETESAEKAEQGVVSETVVEPVQEHSPTNESARCSAGSTPVDTAMKDDAVAESSAQIHHQSSEEMLRATGAHAQASGEDNNGTVQQAEDVQEAAEVDAPKTEAVGSEVFSSLHQSHDQQPGMAQDGEDGAHLSGARGVHSQGHHTSTNASSCTDSAATTTEMDPSSLDSACLSNPDGAVSEESSSVVCNGSVNRSSSSRLLIDPYGQGSFLTAEEVCELFESPLEELSQPATKRELLACLLGDLRDAYWAKAAGCSPAPATMLPLALQTALDPVKLPGGINIHAVERALSAAEKITWLLPRDGNAQLRFALLHYFSRNWDDAWIELGLFIERSMQVDYDGSSQSNTSDVDDLSCNCTGLDPSSKVRYDDCDHNNDVPVDQTATDDGALCRDDGSEAAESVLLESVTTTHAAVPVQQACYDQTSADDLRMARLVVEKIRLQLSLRTSA